MWEVKTADGGLRDQANTYTWYSTDSSSNGGSAGTAGGGTCSGDIACDTQSYVAAANAAGLCGYTDWRMPAPKELISIMDYGRTSPSIDLTYFPNTGASYFWSASAWASGSAVAWDVDFYFGSADSDFKNNGNKVRLVRAGQ
jgi:hypothetical protein